MRHIALILNIIALIGILTGGVILGSMGTFDHQPVGLVLITGSLG